MSRSNLFEVVSNEPINGQDIWIVLKGHLDYEFKQDYDLYLTAKDNGPYGGKSSTIRLHVNVIDENDNSPICGKSLFIENVRENALLKNFMQIQVTDNDSASNSQFSYSILNSDNRTNHHEWFEINIKTGWLSLKKGIF